MSMSRSWWSLERRMISLALRHDDLSADDAGLDVAGTRVDVLGRNEWVARGVDPRRQEMIQRLTVSKWRPIVSDPDRLILSVALALHPQVGPLVEVDPHEQTSGDFFSIARRPEAIIGVCRPYEDGELHLVMSWSGRLERSRMILPGEDPSYPDRFEEMVDRCVFEFLHSPHWQGVAFDPAQDQPSTELWYDARQEGLRMPGVAGWVEGLSLPGIPTGPVRVIMPAPPRRERVVPTPVQVSR